MSKLNRRSFTSNVLSMIGAAATAPSLLPVLPVPETPDENSLAPTLRLEATGPSVVTLPSGMSLEMIPGHILILYGNDYWELRNAAGKPLITNTIEPVRLEMTNRDIAERIQLPPMNVAETLYITNVTTSPIKIVSSHAKDEPCHLIQPTLNSPSMN